MDKKTIEEKLAQLDERIEILQKPVHRFVEEIEALLDHSRTTDNIELLEFKLKISTLLKRFSNEMVDVHDRIIKDFEEIEDDLYKEK